MASTPGAQTATVTPAAMTTSAANLLAAGQSRRMFHIFNGTAAILYVKFGSAASSTDYTLQVAAGGYYESAPGNPYSGLITGVLATGSGNVQVTSY